LLKRAPTVAACTVVVLALVLLNLPAGAAGRVKLAFGSLFLPIFGLTGAAQSFVDRASYSLLTRDTLISEIERLKKETDTLQLTAAQARDLLAENNRLRAAVGWTNRVPWKARLTRVIAREPTAFWRGATLDFGAGDGARIQLPVITRDGLVGRIRAVTASQSQVALLGDPECGVSIIIQETRDLGILQDVRSAAAGDGMVTIRLLQSAPQVLAGHHVLTSGLGGVFPRGITVGEIVDTRQVDGGLYTEARVRLAANLNRLEEVFVLLP
jgi:rod shape-determining protein MreC